MQYRPDETWHRLLEWTHGSSKSERLSAQLLFASGFTELDPSHPLGGQDGGKDAVCLKNGERWIMASYFPRGHKSFSDVKSKFKNDLAGVWKNSAVGIAFVTNQEIRLAERSELATLAGSAKVEIFHLDRNATILDTPEMAGVRGQFLDIDFNNEKLKQALAKGFQQNESSIKGYATGGDTFCYLMLYHFDLTRNIAQNFAIIKKGEFPLYDIRLRIRDMDQDQDVFHANWGEMSAPAEFKNLQWPLTGSLYYRVFFHARNGQWHQDLILNRSDKAGCWLAATRVSDFVGKPNFEHLDNEYEPEFGPPGWRP